ncbi:hypothetical protein G7B40_011695 [Aetokthonos hydrillicola Thurmond2011]|jgi:integrase/recombinase XerD|uniref:Integrase n=1 Tax=Aetokthonos hydrillicola Thurmond2011 TaxID=2712845 RepID=A0AAP5I5R8_9CYAN|nr:hypothetical protein [Aetokthonos hydrillicola]MBW4584682.1 hypothetical protein [Aetokthonos hydrillicola CCALA 1050]MDR9895225.1 hypothetical protein [Aetokthonos hydrillicola Thurmond2011]
MLKKPATLTNSELIDMWLHGKSKNTVDGYRRYAERFSRHIEYKPLSNETLLQIALDRIARVVPERFF